MNKVTEKKQQQQLVDKLVKDTHFNKHEIDKLLKKFINLKGDQQKIDRTMFRDILFVYFKMSDDVLMDRVFKVFDKDNDSAVSMEEWVRGLSVYLRGTIQEHRRFCFNVYDLNGDEKISREEMFQVLKSCIVNQSTEEDPDEGVRDLVEICLKKMDTDGDHFVSFEDYQEACCKDSLIMESLGPVLPSYDSLKEFQAIFKE